MFNKLCIFAYVHLCTFVCIFVHFLSSIAVNVASHQIDLAQILNLAAFEPLARDCIHPMFYDYYAGGADDEITVSENTKAFRRLRLRPRVMQGVGVSASRTAASELFGARFAMPIGIAPMALQGLAHPDGELAMARAAADANALMIISTTATYSVEEIANASCERGGTTWFQLYVFNDREASRDLVRRVEEVGCKALVLTADTPYLGRRERDIRNQFHIPPHLETKNYQAIGASAVPEVHHNSGLAQHFGNNVASNLTWDDVEWFCGITSLPVVVKGVLRGDDALKAAQNGARGVIVSNHGGRQLDTALATIDALPEIVDSVRSAGFTSEQFPIFLDGGIRRGTDALKAVALGAEAVFIGRPMLWALATAGEDGVRRALQLIHQEFADVLGLVGCSHHTETAPDLIAKVI
jgi:isopentenyl diphosphate isomerase/L-lactate dehydrogenase-like FMN-dependent dehydrogenase